MIHADMRPNGNSNDIDSYPRFAIQDARPIPGIASLAAPLQDALAFCSFHSWLCLIMAGGAAAIFAMSENALANGAKNHALNLSDR